MWAKGQWAPFRQLPLAKKTQGVCALPGLEVPAARGLADAAPAGGGARAGAAPEGAAAAGGGAGGLAGPGAVVEGDVTPLGPAWFWVAAGVAAIVAGIVPATEVTALATLFAVWGGPGVSAKAAIFGSSSLYTCKARTAFAASSPARASSAEALGTGRRRLESIQVQNAQNELAAGKTLGIQ